MTATRASLFICKACGTQFPESTEPPRSCAICEDDRQYIPPAGQQWTTLERLRAGYRNAFQQIEPNLIGIGITPDFAIGQRALLLRTPGGNFLWDCIALLDEATIQIVRALGGLSGIAISHPHYYASMMEWSAAFDDAPVYLHAGDREWVMRPGAAIQFWEGERKEIAPRVTLIRCGGHFAGATVLHWAEGSGGGGALLSGDVVAVMPDGFVSFMYSYPNAIPVPARAIQQIADALEPFAFDAIYGAFWDRLIRRGGKTVVADSVARYLQAIAPEAATR
jgi:glyoxylase-like metal-dependent hydrolase (beta-lactamase superfamily II)